VLLTTGGYGWSNSGLYWHTIQNNSVSGALSQVDIPGLLGSNAHLQIRVAGNTYEAYVNGTLVSTLNTPLFTSGGVAVYQYSPSQTLDNFQVTVATPLITVLPGALAFSLKKIGSTSAEQTVTLSNNGWAVLNLVSMVAHGDFAISSNTCGATLAPTSSCSLGVTYTPTTVGAHMGSLVITSDAANGLTTNVALNGTLRPVDLTPILMLLLD
jgi:hypothetical protein